MKLFVFLLFGLLCCISADSVYDNLRKKLALEAILAHSNRNIIVSPLLVRFALCKLASFADGVAKQELLAVLGIHSDSNLQNCYTDFEKIITTLRDMDLIILNKIFVNYTNDINPLFMKGNTSFGVHVDKVGYNFPTTAVSFINRWVDRASYKRITDILEATDIDNKTSILSINGASFKVTWEFPFDIRLTRHVKFHQQSGNASMVPMMTKRDYFFYYDDMINNLQIVHNIKLAAFGLTVTLVIPRTTKALQDFLHILTINPDYLRGIYKQMWVETINLKLPKFKIKTNIEWNNILDKIGVKQIFNETHSGLNAILKDNITNYNVYLSKMKQKNFIDVDEMGIYRQPIVPDMFTSPYAVHGPETQVIADHPFYFGINLDTDRNTHWELFTGVYYGPE